MLLPRWRLHDLRQGRRRTGGQRRTISLPRRLVHTVLESIERRKYQLFLSSSSNWTQCCWIHRERFQELLLTEHSPAITQTSNYILVNSQCFFIANVWRDEILIQIIIIINPLSMNIILNVDEWGNLECLYKACQAAITDGGLFTDTGVNKRGETEWLSENESEMKTVRH